MTSRGARWAAIAAGVYLIVSMLLACASFIAPLQLAFYFVAGWIKFLIRTAPEVTIDWPSLGIALLALALFFAGLHVFVRWLWRARSSGLAASWPMKRSLAAASLIVILFVAGLSMIGLTHQLAWMVSDREPLLGSDFVAHFRSSSSNNLHQIGIGIHNYADVYTSFPPGGTRDERGRMMHGWQTLLLPFVEQRPLADRIDLSKPWNSPRNAPKFKRGVPTFLVPSRERLPTHDADGFAVSHYTGNVLVLGGDKAINFQDVKDGTSNTILGGEAITNPKAWGFPAHWRDPRLGINKSPDGFGGPWHGGSQVIMIDASTRFLSEDIDPRVLAAITTPDGGEEIEQPE